MPPDNKPSQYPPDPELTPEVTADGETLQADQSSATTDSPYRAQIERASRHEDAGADQGHPSAYRPDVNPLSLAPSTKTEVKSELPASTRPKKGQRSRPPKLELPRQGRTNNPPATASELAQAHKGDTPEEIDYAVTSVAAIKEVIRDNERANREVDDQTDETLVPTFFRVIRGLAAELDDDELSGLTIKDAERVTDSNLRNSLNRKSFLSVGDTPVNEYELRMIPPNDMKRYMATTASDISKSNAFKKIKDPIQLQQKVTEAVAERVKGRVTKMENHLNELGAEETRIEALSRLRDATVNPDSGGMLTPDEQVLRIMSEFFDTSLANLVDVVAAINQWDPDTKAKAGLAIRASLLVGSDKATSSRWAEALSLTDKYTKRRINLFEAQLRRVKEAYDKINLYPIQ